MGTEKGTVKLKEKVNKNNAVTPREDGRDRLLKTFVGDSTSISSGRNGAYYPGAGEYAPSKVMAGRT